MQNRISSQTHNWYIYASWEKESQNLGFFQMIYHGGVEGQNTLLFAYLGTYVVFMEQPVVSLSLYNGTIHWLLGPGWEWSMASSRSHLKMYVRNRWSPIHNSHAFAFKLHILHKSDIFAIGRLLIEDVTGLIVINLWKVDKNMTPV